MDIVKSSPTELRQKISSGSPLPPREGLAVTVPRPKRLDNLEPTHAC